MLSRANAGVAYVVLGAISFWTPNLLFRIHTPQGFLTLLSFSLIMPLTLFAGYHAIGFLSRQLAHRPPAALLIVLGLFCSGPLAVLLGFFMSGEAHLLSPNPGNEAGSLMFILFFPFATFILAVQGGTLLALLLGIAGIVIQERARSGRHAGSGEITGGS